MPLFSEDRRPTERGHHRVGWEALDCECAGLGWEITGEPVHPGRTILAGDLGVVRRVTWSDGSVTEAIDVSWGEERIAFYQRRLKKKRISKNWPKVQAKIRNLHRCVANIRKDAAHKATNDVSKTHADVVLGDLV